MTEEVMRGEGGQRGSGETCGQKSRTAWLSGLLPEGSGVLCEDPPAGRRAGRQVGPAGVAVRQVGSPPAFGDLAIPN